MQAIPGINVLAGEVVEVTASGEYRIPRQTSPVGPTGIVAASEQNYPDEPFRSGRHGAATIRVGKGGVMAGALVYSCTTMLVPYSGAMLVGINRTATKALIGALVFDYAIRPATPEEWQTGRAAPCSTSNSAADRPWVKAFGTNLGAFVRSRPSLAAELLSLTHPSGRNPVLAKMRRVESQAPLAVEFEIKWEGGLSRSSYITRITWELDHGRHIQALVKDEGSVPFAVNADHKRKLDAFFRDQVLPTIAR